MVDRTHQMLQPQILYAAMSLQVGAHSCQLTGSKTIFLIATHEREREQEVPSNIPDERIILDVPDLPPAQREPEDLDRRGREDQGTAPNRSIEIPPEPAPEGDPIGQDAHDPTRRPGEYEGECWSCMSTLPCVDPYQSQGEISGMQHLR